jgi:protein-S-isoprenylcysteine O-methyltransferase Ste14
VRSLGLTRWTVPVLFAIAAASTGLHTAGDLGHALTQPSTRAWLVLTYGVLRTAVALAFALFTIGRAPAHRPSRSAVAVLACIAAMAAVIAFTAPGPATPEELLIAGELVAVAFCVWLLISVLFLGRCFGVLPEARGLVTSGPYRFMRHPVYLGEIGACAGLAIAAASLANAMVLATLIIAQVVRMHLEERALTQAFPAYAEYAASTPRLVPSFGLIGPFRVAKTARPFTAHRRLGESAPPALSETAPRA